MDYKYTPGDRVRVIDMFESGRNYYMRSGPKANVVYHGTGSSVIPIRLGLQGKIVTIASIDSSHRYRINEDKEGYSWTDEMFSGLAGNECYCDSLL